MGEIKEVHEIKEGDRFADERAARSKESISFAKKFLVEPTRALEKKLSPDIYSTFHRLTRVFVNAIANNGLNNENDIRFSMQQCLNKSEKERVLEETKNLLKILSDSLGINNVIENLEITKLNENESRNKKENKYSIVLAYKIICDELLNTQEQNKESDNQNIIDMMNMILSNLDGVPENVKFSVTDKKKEPEPIKKQAPVLPLEFKDYAELESKLRGIDKSKVKKLTLKCTGSKICENINLDGFENLKQLFIDNCSVVLSEKDENGNDRYYCDSLSMLEIENSVIRDLSNIKSNEDGECACVNVRDSKISIANEKLKELIEFSFENSINWLDENQFTHEGINPFFNRVNSKLLIHNCSSISKFLKKDVVDIINLLNTKGYSFSSEVEFLPYFDELKNANSKFIPSSSLYDQQNKRYCLEITEFKRIIIDSRYKKFLDGLNGNVVIQIKDMSELDIEDIKKIENICGADSKISVSPGFNINAASHCDYELEIYKKCRTVVDNILKDVDEINEDKSNELDVFLQVYRKLGELISYDYGSLENEKSNLRVNSSRNLIGGLLEKQCVCAGYAEILRNVLSCKKIECTYLGNDTNVDEPDGHAYNQVKIGGKWYYTDLTWDTEHIKKGESLENCLLSQEEFEKLGNGYRVDGKLQTIHEAQESYDRQTIADTIKQQDERKKKLQARTNVGLQQLKSRLSALGIDGYDDIKVNFEDKNSIKFEQQMLELGKQIGVINSDFDLQSLKLDNMGDFDRTTMLLSYANFIQAKSVTPNACKKQLISMYEKMGIKTSDLAQMMAIKQNTKTQEINKQQEGEAK